MKEVFRLADLMKKGPFDPEGFGAALARHRVAVAQMGEATLDGIIGWRAEHYDGHTWSERQVELADCNVWTRMGGRDWATGRVPSVAEGFSERKPAEPEDRIWRVVGALTLFYEALPIIVTLKGHEYHIDDGSHRAVAAWLAGTKKMPAFVGEPKVG